MSPWPGGRNPPLLPGHHYIRLGGPTLRTKAPCGLQCAEKPGQRCIGARFATPPAQPVSRKDAMRNLICRIRGHKVLCEQKATLYADGRAMLDHVHKCLRCRRVKNYGTEELSPEWALMLANEVEVTGVPVIVNVDPPYAHRGRA